MIKFSVLVANYNNAPYINGCINSVLKQSYTEWELIFVDDYSTDNSIDIISKFEDPRIKHFKNSKNYGCGTTKRKCVYLAEGKIMGFLDPDDELLPNAIELMVEYHIKNLTYSLIYSTNYRCDESLNIIESNQSVGSIPENESYLSSFKNGLVVGHFATFKLSSYMKTEGIEKGLISAVDQDLYYKLEEQGKILFIDKPLYLYRYFRKKNRGLSTNGNLIFANLNHLKVAKKAYKRRKLKVSGIKNISIRKLNNIIEEVYINACLQYNNREKEYYKYLFKAFVIRPFNRSYLKLNLLLDILKFWK